MGNEVLRSKEKGEFVWKPIWLSQWDLNVAEEEGQPVRKALMEHAPLNLSLNLFCQFAVACNGLISYLEWIHATCSGPATCIHYICMMLQPVFLRVKHLSPWFRTSGAVGQTSIFIQCVSIHLCDMCTESWMLPITTVSKTRSNRQLIWSRWR